MAHANPHHDMDFFDVLVSAAGEPSTGGPAPDDCLAGARWIPHCLAT